MNNFNEALLRNHVFHSGCILTPERLIFLAHYQPALNRGIGIAEVLLLEGGTRWSSLGRFKWQASGLLPMADDRGSIAVLGRDGEIALVAEGGVAEEDRLPGAAVGPTRGLAAVNGEVMAYGMKREIFRRLGPSQWAVWNQGMNPALPAGLDMASAIKYRMTHAGGLNAVLPGPDGAIYAFGLRGEIWRRMGESAWGKIDSPTNLSLAAATLGDDGLLYACGQAGTLIRGIGEQWESVEYEGSQGLDFCSIAWFDGAPYMADGHSLRTLRSAQMQVVDLGVGAIVPCSHLYAKHNYLLAVAGKEILFTRNGVDWTSLLA